MVPAVGVQPGRPVQAALGLGTVCSAANRAAVRPVIGEAVNEITGGVCARGGLRRGEASREARRAPSGTGSSMWSRNG